MLLQGKNNRFHYRKPTLNHHAGWSVWLTIPTGKVDMYKELINSYDFIIDSWQVLERTTGTRVECIIFVKEEDYNLAHVLFDECLG